MAGRGALFGGLQAAQQIHGLLVCAPYGAFPRAAIAHSSVFFCFLNDCSLSFKLAAADELWDTYVIKD